MVEAIDLYGGVFLASLTLRHVTLLSTAAPPELHVDKKDPTDSRQA